MGLSSSFPQDVEVERRLPQLSLIQLRAYYTAAVALAQGSTHSGRLGLPEELVILICRFADFSHPNPEYTITDDQNLNVYSSGPLETQAWIRSPPLTRQMLEKIRSVQLVTDSKHQGWVSNPDHGSWSWFDLCIYRFNNEVNDLQLKILEDGSPASWTSHHHSSQESEEYELHNGMVFETNHPLWSSIREGDALVVTLNAQFPGWRNDIRWGMLRVDTWWQPSATMMNLMYKNM